jgi:hypothetical protein
LAFVLLYTSLALAAPGASLWERWAAHDEASKSTIDHAAWDQFLDRYVKRGADGINRVPYGSISGADRAKLHDYLAALQATPISKYARAEQRAYWINLYNATTVDLVVAHYPIKSIRDISISPGWFASGPWGKKLLKVEGEELALDDIEHRILRPIWRDPRNHYAVNCASLGCPNLQPRAFTAAFMEAMLEEGARAYVNHPRGAHVRDDGLLEVSSLYKWFVSDFGGEKGVLEHLRRYAGSELAQDLPGKTEIIDYRYDWSLNDVK